MGSRCSVERQVDDLADLAAVRLLARLPKELLRITDVFVHAEDELLTGGRARNLPHLHGEVVRSARLAHDSSDSHGFLLGVSVQHGSDYTHYHYPAQKSSVSSRKNEKGLLNKVNYFVFSFCSTQIALLENEGLKC